VTLLHWRGHADDVRLQRYDVRFEDGLRLVGVGTAPGDPPWGPTVSVRAGSVLPVWLAWGADSRLERNIAFSLHLVADDGRLVAQVDEEMGHGRFPTSLWHTWLDRPVIAGEFLLAIPPDLPAGVYALLGGAFERDSMATLMRPEGLAWVKLASVDVR